MELLLLDLFNAYPMPNHLPANLIASVKQTGIKLTAPRRNILQTMWHSQTKGKNRHPTPEGIYAKLAPRISLATVYRTLKLFEQKKIVIRHNFKDQKAHYELNPLMNPKEFNPLSLHRYPHHDHLIDLESGQVLEFYSQELEQLQEKLVRDLGYQILDHRLEIYAKPLAKTLTKTNSQILAKNSTKKPLTISHRSSNKAKPH